MHTHNRTTLRSSLLLTVAGLYALALLVLTQAFPQGSVFARTSGKTVSMVLSTSSDSVDMRAAIDQRTAMLQRTVSVQFMDESQEHPVATMTLSMKEHPLWIIFTREGSSARAVIDAERLKQHLISYPPQGIPEPRACILLSTWVDDDGVTRAQTDCTARSGFVYDTGELVMRIKEAIEHGEETVQYALTSVPAVITDPMNGSAVPMKLLATGRSTFEGSGLARKSNVRKALNERIHNVLIPADTVFSFNDTLGVVSVNRGWQMALTIFEGTNLRPAPGGGVCQASTTMFRAALEAGLPIVEQKNHSLYVTYYEKFGVGQDATIFPGKQDLRFRNDTGGPLLVQAYNDGEEAYVRLYGYDDGRTVTITGPYFGKTAPKELLENGKLLRTNEIGWERTVQKGGEAQREVFIARYKAIPKSLVTKWPLTTEVTRGVVPEGIVTASR